MATRTPTGPGPSAPLVSANRGLLGLEALARRTELHPEVVRRLARL
ncbi:MAG: hypothetical protein QOE38_1887, partial [Thermoleophilaceae bacterium]|nr:hypothetical protein [Thermoleophilaceae bacterium]